MNPVTASPGWVFVVGACPLRRHRHDCAPTGITGISAAGTVVRPIRPAGNGSFHGSQARPVPGSYRRGRDGRAGSDESGDSGSTVVSEGPEIVLRHVAALDSMTAR